MVAELSVAEGGFHFFGFFCRAPFVEVVMLSLSGSRLHLNCDSRSILSLQILDNIGVSFMINCTSTYTRSWVSNHMQIRITLSSPSLFSSFPSLFPSLFVSHLLELRNPYHLNHPLDQIQRVWFSRTGLTLTTTFHFLPPHLIRLQLIHLLLIPPPLIPLHSIPQHLFPQLMFHISHSRSLPSVSAGGHTFGLMMAIILSRCFLRKEARAASLLLFWSEIAC